MSRLISILKESVMVPGPSGFEGPIRRFIVDRLRSLGLEPRVDEVGNVYVELGSGNSRLVVAAHMDELGLVVTHVGDDGLISFRKLGGIDDRVLPGQHVQLLTENGVVEGVIGITPPHLMIDERERDRVLRWSELRIDVGASSREEAEEMGIKPLTPAVFKKHWSTLAGGKVVATRALDDRVGVSILLELARMAAEGEVRPPQRLVLAWTVQEEVGLRGASYIAQKLEADAMLAVDTMACCLEQITGSARPGGGPVLRALDNQYVAPEPLRRWLLEAASRAGVPLQLATAGGTTDAAAFQRSGIPSVAVGILTRYAHSTAETAHVSDIEAALRLVAEAVSSAPQLRLG